MKKLITSLTALAIFAIMLMFVPAKAADPSQFAYPIQGPPISTVSVSIASASTTTLNGGTCYRVACSVTVFWRVGVLPLTALISDNQMFGPAVELICLRNGYNGIAFITAAGTGTCTVNSYAPGP